MKRLYLFEVLHEITGISVHSAHIEIHQNSEDEFKLEVYKILSGMSLTLGMFFPNEVKMRATLIRNLN